MARKKQKKEKQPPKPKSPLAPRSMWKGSISFGLVNIPVRLYPALKPKDIRFHMLHKKDKSRIEEQIVCIAEHKKIPRDEIVKGYEIAAGQHVIISDEELQALAPKASRTIELVQFIELEEIDPLYYDRPYYLLPEETARKAYSLFVTAMERAGKVGIAKFVMRKKEYLGALRAMNHALYLDTMHFADEIVTGQEIGNFFTPMKVEEREIKAAQELIESLSDEFEPEKLHDEYREAVQQLIQQKIEGKEVSVSPVKEEEKPEIVDLMAALEASLKEAKKTKRKAA